MKTQLLWFPGCPSAEDARQVVRRALAAEKMPVLIEEIDTSSATTPSHLKAWGSPTVLINGHDVGGREVGDFNAGHAAGTLAGPCCRVYGETKNGQRLRGVPSEAQVRQAIRAARSGGGWLSSVVGVPGSFLALLPSAVCPACLGVYGAILSGVGLGFLANERVLVPMMAVLLAAGLASLAWSARKHRRFGPLALALLGSAAIVAGHLGSPALGKTVLNGGGAAAFLGASLWNAWLRRMRPCVGGCDSIANGEGTHGGDHE